MAIVDINEEALQVETKKEFKEQGFDIFTKKANVVNREEVKRQSMKWCKVWCT